MAEPLLSVVIPTWNRAHLVCQAIDSVLAQQKSGIEVIVVDDGSTDDTQALLHERYDSAVVVVRNAARRGVGVARNVGVSQARGEFVAFLDSDDLWLPGKFDAELSVFKQFPGADAVVGDSRYFFGDVEHPQSRFAKNGALQATGGRPRWQSEASWMWTVCHNGVGISVLTMRRCVLDKLGLPLFAEDLTSCEDWELEVRLYQECRVAVLPEVYTHIRCIDDGTRIGRACPGTPRTREQDMSLIRDRLTAMERAVAVDKLDPALSAAFHEYRELNRQQLSLLQTAPDSRSL